MASRTLLSDFFKRTKESQNAFARRIGATSAMVCRWTRGERIPTAFYAVAIEGATAGSEVPIPVEYWARLEGEGLGRRWKRRHAKKVARPNTPLKGAVR